MRHFAAEPGNSRSLLPFNCLRWLYRCVRLLPTEIVRHYFTAAGRQTSLQFR